MADNPVGNAEAIESAEASEREATGHTPKIFMVPIEDGEDIQLVLPNRWKRAKFLKAMRSGDIWGALESIWPPVDKPRDEDGEESETSGDDEDEKVDHPELEKLLEVDMDEKEFRLLLERLGETLMGRKPPQGKASRR